MTAAPQKIAIRRLVRGADGQTRSILVDAYSYVPVADPTGYQVVDVSDVPEQVHDVNQPDAEKPVTPKVDRTTTASIRGGSEFGGSSRGGQNNPFGKTPSTSAPSRAHVNQSFPSAPSNTQTAPSQSVPSAQTSTPSVGSNMPSGTSIDTTSGSPVSAPSPSNANPPGYSQPGAGGATPTNAPTPSQVHPDSVVGSGAAEPAGFQAQGSATPRGIGNYNPGPDTTSSGVFGGYSSPSGNNNGRGTGIASSPAPSAPSAPSSGYGGMYGGAGFGGGYTPDTSKDTSTARSTVDAAGTPQSATERSQAMGSVPDSATSPAAAAARGLVDRTPAQLDRIGLTIAGEVTGQTLADLTSPDPATQAAAKAQVANIQATIENRAATDPWGTVENALTPSQYNSLTPGKQLNVSTKNYATYNAALSSTVKDFYTGLNPPTNYNFTNYANTNPIPGKYAPPGWLDTIQDPTQVGPFTFGTDPAYSNPGRFTPAAQANYAAAQADYGAAGAYKQSPDYGTDPGWGTFADPANPNGYGFGYGYGQSAVDPGWGGFAGAQDNSPYSSDSGNNNGRGLGTGGGYTSSSGNGNGRGTGIGNGGGSGYGGGGNSSTGGGSGYGGGSAGNGTASGGGAGMSGGGGYSPGGMGSPSGSSNDGGGYGGGGDENGDAGGGGAGTRGNGAGSYGGL